MNYIICSVFVFACTTSLYSSQQNVPKVDMVKYFSKEPLPEIFKLGISSGTSDERVVALNNNPNIAQILLHRISENPQIAASHLHNLCITVDLLAPQKPEDTVTAQYIKANALYTTIHEIAIKDKNFSERYEKIKSRKPSAHDLVEHAKAGNMLAQKEASEQNNATELETLTSYANEKTTADQHKTAAPLSSDPQLHMQDSGEIPALEPDPDSEQNTSISITISSDTEAKESYDLDTKQSCPIDKLDQHKDTASVTTESQSNAQIPGAVTIDIGDYDENSSEEPSDINIKVDQYQEEDTSDYESDDATSDNQNGHRSGYHSINEEEYASEKTNDSSDYEIIGSNSEAERSESSKTATDDNDEDDDSEYSTATDNTFSSDNKDGISDKTPEKESAEASHSTEQTNPDSTKAADGADHLEKSRIAKERLAQNVSLAECIAKNGICNALINAESTESSDQYTSRMTQYHTALQQMSRNDLIHILKNRNDLTSTINALAENINNENNQLDDSVIAYYKYVRGLCIEATLRKDNNNNKNNIQNNKPNTTNKPIELTANSFFKRHPFALATAITVTAASIYYAYNYWYAAEATDSAQ